MITAIVTFLSSAVRCGMVLLFGATGEILTEKSGHLNLGIPGVMCVGAACGCVAESIYYTNVRGAIVPWIAILIGILATLFGGALMGAIFSFFTVTLNANQNVSGLVLTTLGVGISNYMIAQVNPMTYAPASKMFVAYLPFADKLGWFGDLFFSYGIMIYLALAIALVTNWFLKRTRVGLHLRSVGENPATADAAGINVPLYRYLATMIGCGIAGLGGMTFIMDYLLGSWEYVIDSIGWLAVALVIFSIWRPNLAIVCSVIFGGFYVASSYIPNISLAVKELFKMLPYAVTTIVLIATSIRNRREDQPPASLGISYFREER